MKKYIVILLVFFVSLDAQLFSQIVDNQPSNGLFQPRQTHIRPAPLPSVREADVMWSKRIWREIDFKQKMNQKFYYPIEPRQDYKSFVTVILDAVKSGELTAYDINNTDELLIPITYNEIKGRQTDTIYTTMRRPYPPYDEYDTVIYTEFDPTKIMRLRVKEDWYFDKQRSQMLVRIIAMCPVIIKERDGEEGTEPLFWFSFDESRPILANALVFNPDNSANRLSFDDVFIRRFYSSYIYKEQNMFDRRISQYALGIDALMESERIKRQMLDFEQFLWEY
jgi:gliding motility associated protien GldN